MLRLLDVGLVHGLDVDGCHDVSSGTFFRKLHHVARVEASDVVAELVYVGQGVTLQSFLGKTLNLGLLLPLLLLLSQALLFQALALSLLAFTL